MPLGVFSKYPSPKKMLLFLVLVGAGSAIHSTLKTKPAEMITCRTGAYWVYDTVSREQQESGEIKTISARKKISVLDVLNGKNLAVALLESKDFAGTEPPSYSIRLVVDNVRFYEYDVPAEERISSWKSMKDLFAAGRQPELPEESSLQMILPSEIGTKWDEEGGTARTDGMYCWLVENIRELPASTKIANNRIADKTSAYTISFRTCPDHQIKTFVPGIGFIDSQYRHHGSVFDTDERLIEFHQGS